MKNNDVIIYTAEGYANAETVGRVDDYTVFVPQMIVGERAKVKLNHVKRNVAYGTVVELLKASDKRAKPLCPRFGKCGGCSLMHMSYSEQLLFKRNKVEANIRKLAKIDVEVLPCVPSDKTCGYRNKLSLPVSGKCGSVHIGMYERNTHKVVDTHGCQLGGDWATLLVELFKHPETEFAEVQARLKKIAQIHNEASSIIPAACLPPMISIRATCCMAATLIIW